MTTVGSGDADLGQRVHDLNDILTARRSIALVERTGALLSGSRPGGHAEQRRPDEAAYHRPERRPGLVELHDGSRPTRSFPFPA